MKKQGSFCEIMRKRLTLPSSASTLSCRPQKCNGAEVRAGPGGAEVKPTPSAAAVAIAATLTEFGCHNEAFSLMAIPNVETRQLRPPHRCRRAPRSNAYLGVCVTSTSRSHPFPAPPHYRRDGLVLKTSDITMHCNVGTAIAAYPGLRTGPRR